MADNATSHRKIKLQPRTAHQSPVWPELVRRAQERVHPHPPGEAAVIAEEMNDKLWGLNPRTILSIVRTLIYGGLAVFLALRPATITGPLDAAIYGAVFADYLTWLIWSFFLLPRHLLHGSYEALINIVFGIVLVRSWSVNLSDDNFAEGIGVMFLCFMAVLLVKIVCLSVTLMDRGIDSDL